MREELCCCDSRGCERQLGSASGTAGSQTVLSQQYESCVLISVVAMAARVQNDTTDHVMHLQMQTAPVGHIRLTPAC